MKSIRRTVCLLVSLLAANESPGQFVLSPSGGFSFRYTKVKKNAALSVSYRRSFDPFYGPVFGGPFGPGFAHSRFTQIVVVSPPVVVVPPRFVFAPPEFEPPPRLRAAPMEDEEFDPPLPGRDAGVFRPLDPENRDRARRPVPPPPKEEEPPPKKEAPPPDRPMPPPQRRDDPLDEGARQMELGREAFARGEYGRAAERFGRAAHLSPANPLAHLLLGQAHLAIGNHRRAFDAIQVGLRLQPDWPKQAFQPIALHGEHAIDYAEQVRLLEELLSATPDDPVLLFLHGYQLWFDGRREEGVELLARCGPVLPDPGIVERFLQAMPTQPPL